MADSTDGGVLRGGLTLVAHASRHPTIRVICLRRIRFWWATGGGRIHYHDSTPRVGIPVRPKNGHKAQCYRTHHPLLRATFT